jgi:PAS domain S-box-containing protein
MRESSEHLARALERAEVDASRRGSGASYTEILQDREGPLVLELITAVLTALSETGSRLRRAEARAAYAEGLSMEKIGRIFGVSRQRVSSLLQPSATDALNAAAHAAGGGGMMFTDPEFRRIAETLPHIVWVGAPDGTTEYINAQGTDYTGVPRTDFYDWGWVELLHPDDAERAREGWEEATRSGSPFELEYRIRRADGEYRWHDFRALPFRNPDGSVAKWVGTATDIEQSKRLEAELRDREQRTAEALGLVEMLQESAPIGFGFVDRDLRIVRMNARLGAISGVPVDEQLGRSVAEVVPALWPQLEGAYRQVLDRGEPVRNLEVAGETGADPGREHRFLASYYPVRVGGEVIGVGIVVVELD